MKNILLDVENYVTKHLNENLDSNFVYHNLAHTQRVVEKVLELTDNNEVTEDQKRQLLIAAWFHDTGFVNTIEGHEKESAKIADTFLSDYKLPSSEINAIKQIILATEMSHEPTNKQEGIIRDADSAHISSKNYEDYASLLRKEWELTLGKEASKDEWLQENIDFLSSHTFNSPIASSKWEKRKGKNLATLIQSQNKIKARNEKLKQRKAELTFKKEKQDLPDRGIETMFRVALRNHITLSDIADTKANILLSVNAIIISVALSNLLPKLDNPSNDYLIIPTLIFMAFTVICIVLSVLATRPNVTKGQFTKDDVANKKYLYGSLTKDLYFLGLVLNRKYNLLRTTYGVFMIGIVISVIAFSVSFILSETAINT